MTKSSHRVKAQNANANNTSVVNQSQSGQHVNTIPYSTFQKIKGLFYFIYSFALKSQLLEFSLNFICLI